MDQNTISRAGLPIGELSRLTGCSVETIRYYESIGLLPRPARTQGGRRAYGEVDVGRLRFIRRSRDFGFTLDDVRELLSMVEAGRQSCAAVRTIATGHLERVRQKIAALRQLERALSDMVACCSNTPAPDCELIERLLSGSASNPTTPRPAARAG